MQSTAQRYPTHQDPIEAHLVEVCAEELWEGVYCVLPPDHTGSHVSAASHGGCSFTWRSPTVAATANQDAPATGATLDSFLRLMRAGTQR
jgi:hypothetical protein